VVAFAPGAAISTHALPFQRSMRKVVSSGLRSCQVRSIWLLEMGYSLLHANVEPMTICVY